MQQKELVEFIARSLVDSPDLVTVTEKEGEQGTVLELAVSREDLGKIIGKQGRNLSLQASGGWSRSHNSSYSKADVVTRQKVGADAEGQNIWDWTKANSTHQFTTTPSVNWNVRVGGGYVEPIVGNLFGELRYNFTHRFNDQRRTLWQLHEPKSLTDIMGQWTGYYHYDEDRTGYVDNEQPGTTELLNEFLQMSEEDVYAAIRDEQNSQYATYKYDNHAVNLGLRYNDKDRGINLNAGLAFNPEHTRMDYQKGAVDTLITRTIFNISPQVRFRWNIWQWEERPSYRQARSEYRNPDRNKQAYPYIYRTCPGHNRQKMKIEQSEVRP